MIASLLTTDRLTDVAALLRERKLRSDPRYPGELARWFENPGVRRWYYSPAGMTIDTAGEAIGERFAHRRLDESEVLELLNLLFHDANLRKTRATDSSRSVIAAEEHAVEVRMKTRLRLYTCAGCGKKIRVADDSLTAEHVHVDPDTLTESRAPFVRVTPVLNPMPF